MSTSVKLRKLLCWHSAHAAYTEIVGHRKHQMVSCSGYGNFYRRDMQFESLWPIWHRSVLSSTPNYRQNWRRHVINDVKWHLDEDNFIETFHYIIHYKQKWHINKTLTYMTNMSINPVSYFNLSRWCVSNWVSSSINAQCINDHFLCAQFDASLNHA